MDKKYRANLEVAKYAFGLACLMISLALVMATR